MAPMATHKKSLYEILGVARDASASEVDLAYQRRKAQLEETASSDPGEGSLVRQAYEVLHDPKRRAAYDATLVTTDAREAAAASNTAAVAPIEMEEEPARKVKWLPIALGIVALLVIVYAASRTSKPETPAVHTEAMPGTQVAVPAAPTKKSAMEIMAVASMLGGQVLSYSMSGAAIPIGLAISTDAGTMITTCHGIPAGAKLVVRVEGQSYPADLILTDEVLDLCRLQVANFTAPPLKSATVPAKAGDAVFVVGADQAGKMAVTAATVKSLVDTPEGKLLELSVPIGQFSSGGPVFNEMGEVAGISMVQHRSGLSIAYPAAWIAQTRSRQAPPPAAAPPAK